MLTRRTMIRMAADILDLPPCGHDRRLAVVLTDHDGGSVTVQVLHGEDLVVVPMNRPIDRAELHAGLATMIHGGTSEDHPYTATRLDLDLRISHTEG